MISPDNSELRYNHDIMAVAHDPAASLKRSAEFWSARGAPGFAELLEATAERAEDIAQDPNAEGKYVVTIGTEVADQTFEGIEVAGSYAQHHGTAGGIALISPVSNLSRGLNSGELWAPSLYIPVEYGEIRRDWKRTHRNGVFVLHRGMTDHADYYLQTLREGGKPPHLSAA